MDRTKFKMKVDEIGRKPSDMEVAVIVFNDGERHLTFASSIKEGDDDVSYQDVHTRVSSPPITVIYKVIDRVEGYNRSIRDLG